jgi:hypothetical protein
MMRTVAVLVALLLGAAGSAAAQSVPDRLAVTATSDHCADGLPVVDYTVTNLWPTAVLVQTWWVADASVYGITDAHTLGPAPDSATGAFSLPYDFYATVTVFATATWPDGRTTTSASWAIPVAACDATTTTTTTTPTTLVEPPTTTVVEPTTTDDGGGGNGNGHGRGHATTTSAPPPIG